MRLWPLTSGTFILWAKQATRNNCADARPDHIFYIDCVCVPCYRVDLKWRCMSDSAWPSGTRCCALPFDPLSVCFGRAQESTLASCAHCQPAWHHHIYFYSLQIQPSLYPY